MPQSFTVRSFYTFAVFVGLNSASTALENSAPPRSHTTGQGCNRIVPPRPGLSNPRASQLIFGRKKAQKHKKVRSQRT